MKSKMSLLPRMAVNNIRKNGSTYFPYIGVSIFAMFTYFVFDLILKNDVMQTLPKAFYATVLITIGFVLLGIIMVPFLYYTNSFLIKRRKKELGLYSILGLEKKHIGIMMFWESLIVYTIVMAGAIALGLLFSKLIFLLLLNLVRMPVDVAFSISPAAIADALLFYAFVTGLNLFVNLVQVGKARPVELMSDSRRGEKEPKHIAIWTVLGALSMGAGYYLAASSKLDGMIFMNFFLAVFLVIVGTYFLFTSGSIALLRFLKKRKSYYYRADNFVTVSGMLYRMKKNAASLSNICIFATMVIITVICTVSVWLCTDSIIRFMRPRNFEISFMGRQEENALKLEVTEPAEKDAFRQELEKLATENGVTLTDFLEREFVAIDAYKEKEHFQTVEAENRFDYANWYDVDLMTVDAYNRMENTGMSLAEDEVLVFTTGPDFGEPEISFGSFTFRVKEELKQCSVRKKAQANSFNARYLVVFAGEEQLRSVAADFGVNADSTLVFQMAFTPVGDDTSVNAFAEKMNTLFGEKEGFAGITDYREDITDLESMYGSLLFIGIFFGAIFLICLLIIMYYKQVTEGFEDQKNFEIMQKVGMSDEEIRRTIRKQILLVFTLPLAGAILHTIVGMKMVMALMRAIGCFEIGLMMWCTVAVCALFAFVYSICYRRTSTAYYRIVRKMN